MKPWGLSLAAVLALAASCGDSGTQLVGGDGNFDTLSLSSSGGMPAPKRDGDECDSQYTNVTTVTSSPSLIAWDLCTWPAGADQHRVIAQAGRELTSAELATVKEAILKVHVGKSGDCGFDKPVVTLDVQAQGAVGHYVDDFYGCQPPPAGRTFVTGIDWVESAVGKLVP
jgi:hypothetical protein